MNDKPERIWASASIGDSGFWACDADSYDQGDAVAYLRADLADAKDHRIRELEDALLRIKENAHLWPCTSVANCAEEAINKGEAK